MLLLLDFSYHPRVYLDMASLDHSSYTLRWTGSPISMHTARGRRRRATSRAQASSAMGMVTSTRHMLDTALESIASH
jgi:hypothetical protein